MEEPSRLSFRKGRLASRKAEEAAYRRFQAATWLEKMVGPLGLPSQQPSEQEFVSCLKNGLVLCNAINKIQPGAVPKVVTNQSLGLTWENQTLPAYQYFENIRNFLDAVDELKIPSFEASDIERDTVEAGSVGKIVDCILGLKAYHDWKQFSRGSGAWKYVKSPMVSHAKVGIHSKMPALSSSVRYLDMSAKSEKLQPMKLDDDQRTGAKVDSLVQAMTDILCNSKENIDQNIFDSWQQGTVDPVKLFNRIISSCLQEQQLDSVEDSMMEGKTTLDVCRSNNICKNCSFCQGKTSCNHWQLMESQKTELKSRCNLEPIKQIDSSEQAQDKSYSSQPYHIQKQRLQVEGLGSGETIAKVFVDGNNIRMACVYLSMRMSMPLIMPAYTRYYPNHYGMRSGACSLAVQPIRMSSDTVRTFQAAEYTFKKTLSRTSCSGHLSKSDDPRLSPPRSDLDSKVETFLPLKPRLVECMEIKALLSNTKLECAALQSQVQNDLTQIGNQLEWLSTAADGYHRAVKENRNLYNMLQELRGNIQVFCRVRPAFVAGDKGSIDYIGNDGTLILLDQLKSQNVRKTFQFNKVFGPNATQEEVYKATESLIRSVMDGYNVCIFAYGQTGSGKTYSMCGPEIGSAKDIGINSKALNDLFQISCIREDIKYEIHVQMVEIYNEQVRDLLTEETSTKKLEIRNCSSNGGLSLPDATMHHVQSTSDVMNLMKAGEKNRAFSCTAMNNRSSRSHSVLTIHVCGRDVLGNKLQSCLHLVDLAGSERVDKSEVTGDRLKEAQHINKSLSCLGDVIAALAQKSSYIPYRNSKLTQLLQNSLGGHAKMLMLAHVSPEAESYGETISTLKFAQRVSTVELGAAQVNKESSEIRDLREQVDNLKKELASREREKALHLHKMKENTSFSERKLPIKSPLPRSKFSTENSVMRLRRLSLEGCGHDDKSQHQNKNSESDLQQKSQIEEEQLKEVAHEEIKANETIEKLVQVNEIEGGLPSCSAISNSSSVNQLTTLGSRCRQLGEVETPDTNKIKLNSNSFSSSKGSHIRKSLKTIGKLINGSEKRNYQVSSVMPCKQDKDLKALKKSPATVESRYKRRQSLTNVQAFEIKGSRRSSLGGKSVESYSTVGIPGPKTPPAFPAPAKNTNRWL
ncbi:kinesin-like protein KIN-14A [Dendrobium catenatum]|uniref:kinesin-like protein KIN-14A n=1 Tax=Dendrobium catenatum TaxID=906689 RepID=UPI00109F4FDC|nr:kinesin-like protein KIN-14A [Dendrobium catenatum]